MSTDRERALEVAREFMDDYYRDENAALCPTSVMLMRLADLLLRWGAAAREQGAREMREALVEQRTDAAKWRALAERAGAALAASDKAMVAWGHEEDGLPQGHGIGAFEAHEKNRAALAALRAAGVNTGGGA